MSDNRLTTSEMTDRKDGTEQKKNNKRGITGIIAAVIMLQIIIAVFAGTWLFRRGYERNKTNTANNIRKGAYDTVYNLTEEEYHLSNRVTITVKDIQEKADLEVLSIDTYYLYRSDEEDTAQNLTLFYKIPGTGTFTVDMRMTEYIIDNERRHVLVKAPAPAITQFRENYAGIEKLEYRKDGILNGSIKEGEETARKMLARAHTQMMKSFEMTQAYHHAAEESARKLFTMMIKALNPETPELTVDVEFINGTVS